MAPPDLETQLCFKAAELVGLNEQALSLLQASFDADKATVAMAKISAAIEQLSPAAEKFTRLTPYLNELLLCKRSIQKLNLRQQTKSGALKLTSVRSS